MKSLYPFLGLVLLLAACGSSATLPPVIVVGSLELGDKERKADDSLEVKTAERQLVWSDEFNGSGSVDTSKWAFDVGGNGWGNRELQHYTDRNKNARQEAGKLVIEAIKEDYDKNNFTSARLVTRGKQSWTHVRLEARAKLPRGRGTWPAIWMLGENIKTVGWPRCGEIDIMEHVGYAPDSIYGTVHTGAFNHIKGTQDGGFITASDLETDFHVYFINWTERQIDFGMDNEVYFTFEKRENATFAEWPFDEPHYLLLNVAAGGNWGGSMGVDQTIWPQRMEIDWVRVYQ
jgi:beta-glucanase (GH16 family)